MNLIVGLKLTWVNRHLGHIGEKKMSLPSMNFKEKFSFQNSIFLDLVWQLLFLPKKKRKKKKKKVKIMFIPNPKVSNQEKNDSIKAFHFHLIFTFLDEKWNFYFHQKGVFKHARDDRKEKGVYKYLRSLNCSST